MLDVNRGKQRLCRLITPRGEGSVTKGDGKGFAKRARISDAFSHTPGCVEIVGRWRANDRFLFSLIETADRWRGREGARVEGAPRRQRFDASPIRSTAEILITELWQSSMIER